MILCDYNVCLISIIIKLFLNHYDLVVNLHLYFLVLSVYGSRRPWTTNVLFLFNKSYYYQYILSYQIILLLFLRIPVKSII